METHERTEDTALLQQRFTDVWQRLGAGCVPEFEELAERYSEPHRAYHTLAHLSACLQWLDECRELADHPDEVELALFYHDVIYQPFRTDNEVRSAELFRQHAQAGRMAPASVVRVAMLIECTAEHLAFDADSALVNDIDLAVLGAPADEFALYEAQVRKECRRTNRLLYWFGRRQILGSLLRSGAIFKTPFFRQRFEERAQANLRSYAGYASGPMLRSVLGTVAWFAATALGASLLWLPPGPPLWVLVILPLPLLLVLAGLVPGLWIRRGEAPAAAKTDRIRRRPVWDALSELYLDTELDEQDLERIAAILVRSDYTDSQLEEILYRELHPVLRRNLLDIAGEWAGFDGDWLQEQVLASRGSRVPFALVSGKWMVHGTWKSLRRRLHGSRASTPAPA